MKSLTPLKTAFILSAAVLGQALSAQSVVTWDGGASTLNWIDAANWNPDGVPQAVDTANFSSAGNLSINLGSATQVIRNLNFGSNDLTLTSGTLALENGLASGTTGLQGSGNLILGSGAALDFRGRNHITSDSGNTYTLRMQSGSSLLNTTAETQEAIRRLILDGNATVNIANRTDIRNHASFPALLDMNGNVLTKTGSNEFVLVSIGNIQNSGTFQVQSGAIRFEGNTQLNGGTINLSPIAAGNNAQLILWGTSIAQTGTINLNSTTGVATVRADPNVNASLDGPLNFTGNRNYINVTTDANNSGKLTLNGPLSGSGFIKGGAGTLILGAGSNPGSLSQIRVQDGLLETASNLTLSNLGASGGGQIGASSGAVLTLNQGSPLTLGGFTGAGNTVLSGPGAITLTGDKGTLSGNVHVQNANLNIQGDQKSQQGTFIIDGGRTISFENQGVYESVYAGNSTTSTLNPYQLTNNFNRLHSTDRDQFGNADGVTTDVGWPEGDNTVSRAYHGYLINANGSPVQLSFVEQFDDQVFLKVGTNTLLNNASWNTPTTGETTLTGNSATPFELRLYQGGGGVGPNNGFSYGIGVTPGLTGGSVNPADYQPFSAVTLPAGVQLASDLDVSVAQRIQLNGTVNVNTNGLVQGTMASLDGQITNGLAPGRIQKQGQGTLALSQNTNSYTGGTNVQEGTLRLETPGAAGAGKIELQNDTTLAFAIENQAPGLMRYGALGGARYTGDTFPIAGVVETAISKANFGDISDVNQKDLYFGDGDGVAPLTGDNRTWIYKGYIKNDTGSNQIYSFAENFDDSVLLKINGTTLLDNGVWDAPTAGQVDLAPGFHEFELRLFHGGGGVGGIADWSTAGYGFGMALGSTGLSTSASSYAPVTADNIAHFRVNSFDNDTVIVRNDIDIVQNATLDTSASFAGAPVQLAGTITGFNGGQLTTKGSTELIFGADSTLVVGENNGVASSFQLNNDGNLTFSGDIVLGLMQGAAPGSLGVSDLLGVGGTASIDLSQANLVIEDVLGLAETYQSFQAWQVFEWDTDPTGTFANLDLPTLSGGLFWDTSQLYSQGILSVVPEPGKAILLMLSALPLAFGRSRQRPNA